MSEHAGFAAAITVHERVLNDALLAGYANGTFSDVLKVDLLRGPPRVTADFFVALPTLTCEGSTGLLVLTLGLRGPVTVTMAGRQYTAAVEGELELTIAPVFGTGTSLALRPSQEEIVVRRWRAEVTSADTPSDVVAYVAGAQFAQRLQETIRAAVALRLVKLPSIDVSFLGPLARVATSVQTRVRNGMLLFGLNVGDDNHPIAGDIESLHDFARGNDIAAVVNPDAVGLMLSDLHTRMITATESAGAQLDRLSARPASGYFQVSGAVSNSDGTVHFSFHVVPSMFHTRPGVLFRNLPKSRRVNSRTWAALGFRIEAVDVDVERPWWTVVRSVLLGAITSGFVTIYIEELLRAAGENFAGRLKAAAPGAPAARIRRTITPPGGVSVRLSVDQFDITADRIYIGMSARSAPAAAAVLGPASVPSTYRGDALRYVMRLPSGVSMADPALRIRWTLEDRTHHVVLLDQDGPAAGRKRFEFTPEAFSRTSDFGIVGRLYRRLGTDDTELGTQSVNLHMRGPLPPGAYVRWRSEVTNPQITVNESTDVWSYRGESRVRRWSEWHRADAPCRSVHAPSRYRFDHETADRLPFPLRLLENHRKGLCPYCFFGGPAGINPKL